MRERVWGQKMRERWREIQGGEWGGELGGGGGRGEKEKKKAGYRKRNGSVREIDR